MIVLISLLAGEQAQWHALGEKLLQAAAAVALILGAVHYLLPGLMFQVVRLRDQELFMIMVAPLPGHGSANRPGRLVSGVGGLSGGGPYALENKTQNPGG